MAITHRTALKYARALLAHERASVRGNPKVSRTAQAFIGKKIRRLAREGMAAPRRIAAAYRMARRKGYKVPRKNPARSESIAWHDVIQYAKRIERNATDAADVQDARNILTIAAEMKHQVLRGMHTNPTLAVLGNPPAKVVGTLSRRLLELRYVHAEDGKKYRHPFGPGAKVLLLADGSVLLKSPKRLWEDLP